MIDKTIPYYSLTMYTYLPHQYPEYCLPNGYEFVFYRPGDELNWARIECDVGQFSSLESGLEYFQREFVRDQRLDPQQRMLFVKDKNGEYVATASLWDGKFLGTLRQRIHWVAVKDKCAGLGIAKAMLSRLMRLYTELGYDDSTIYLVTGTRNYPAVSIYRKFGFKEYTGPVSLSSKLTDEQFCEQTSTAISIINEKLTQYKSKK